MELQVLPICPVIISDIVFWDEFPFRLLFERDNLDLSEGCFVVRLRLIHDVDQTPITQQLSNSVPSLDIILFQVGLLTIEEKQLLEVTAEVSALLVQDVAGLE